MDSVNAIVVGAGVVGLAIAARLSEKLSNVLVIDKNTSFGEETSSRNSEVIHAGLYYPTDSLKARLCVSGKHKLYDYCQQRHIPHNRLGKLLVGHNAEEEAYLARIVEQAAINGVNDLSWLSQKDIRDFSPELSATCALLSPSTGIVDSHSYMQSLLADLEANGGLFVAQTEFLSAQPSGQGFILELESQGEPLKLNTRYLINSAGLYCQRVANKIAGLANEHIPELHWCRGHYFAYSGKNPFSRLVYPVPEKNGLGIHASLDMGGQLKFGPDTQYVNKLSYEFSTGAKEKFVRAIRKYFPALDVEKLHPSYAGIRPKLQGPGQGFKDFVIQSQQTHGMPGLVNLFGIDSPGLTSSLAIAEHAVDLLLNE